MKRKRKAAVVPFAVLLRLSAKHLNAVGNLLLSCLDNARGGGAPFRVDVAAEVNSSERIELFANFLKSDKTIACRDDGFSASPGLN